LAGDVETDHIDEEPQTGLENVRTHLEVLYNQLNNAVYEVEGENIRKNAHDALKNAIGVYDYHRESDYERILMRRKKIESYKETNETMKREKHEKAQLEATKKEEQRRAEEMKRLEQENKENERKRRLAEQEEVQNKVKQDQLKKLQSNPIYQQIVKERGAEAIQDMDPQAVLREQRERLDAERREQAQKQQQQEKKFDHTVRAFHLEELLERRRLSEERMRNAPALHEQYEERRVAKAMYVLVYAN
jgi:hypothetical protein